MQSTGSGCREKLADVGEILFMWFANRPNRIWSSELLLSTSIRPTCSSQPEVLQCHNSILYLVNRGCERIIETILFCCPVSIPYGNIKGSTL